MDRLPLKLLSADVLHKTDAGMVRLNVEAADAIGTEAERMLQDAKRRFPNAKIDGVLVQRMERGLAEVIVGYRRDPEVGPVVLLGMGGIAAELRKSISVRIAPVTLETARNMIEDIRELELLRGLSQSAARRLRSARRRNQVDIAARECRAKSQRRGNQSANREGGRTWRRGRGRTRGI